MPYKEDNKWRAVVTFHGKRHTAKLETKREAVRWEIEKRKELKTHAKTGMDLLTFCNKYLDFSKRFVKKTYQEKKVSAEESWPHGVPKHQSKKSRQN